MDGGAIHHYHDARLVALSVAIAVMASYTSLDLAGRIQAGARPWSNPWLPAAALAMGGGIWSMHFVAMLSFHTGLPVSYDIALTALSLLLAVVVTGVGLFVVHLRRGERIGLVVGGTLMGVGIVSMHYTGMAAIRMQATISYDPVLVVASVLIAIGAATAALWLSFLRQPLWQRVVSAIVMGAAIAGMHFTGMAAASLQAAPTLPVPEGLGLSHQTLALSIGAATVLVLVLALTAAFFDRRLSLAQVEATLLQRSERRFRALVRNSSDVIAVIDRGGGVVVETAPSAGGTGQQPHTPARKPFLDLVEAADRGQAAALLDAAWADAGVAHKGELTLSIVEGEPPRCYEATFTNLSDEPTIAGVVANLRDVTDRRRAEAELRESEQRYRQVVNLIQAAVLLHADGRVAFANTYAATMLGVASPDDLVGRDILSFVHPEDVDRARARSRRVAESGETTTLAELRYVRLDGRTITAEVQAAPLMHRGRAHVLATARDVTAQREAESQLQQALKMEAVGQLTGGIAHDFNNLLTVVIGNLDAAAEAAPANLRPTIESALHAADRGAVLVQRLLAFSRRQALRPEKMDLNALVNGMADLLRRTLGENVEIAMRLEAGLWPAFADRSQVENALLNLTINARDAMPRGGKLTIETANVQLDGEYAARNRDALPGDYALLAVSDTGTGMTPEIVERAFEPFFTTKETGKGTGLGLSMVYGFARQSGGHLNIYSEVGHGTTIRLYLPRMAVRKPADAPASGDGLPGGSETILVVEDDGELRRFVTAQLRDLGYLVLEAMNGPDARRTLDTDTPVDLLFTDIVMPGGVTGHALAEEARRRRPALKTLLTSGYSEGSMDHQGRLGPNIHLLSKPYKRRDLALKVREVLDSAA